MRVLVIEDEAVLADAIAAGLRRRTMAVDIAYDGASGLERALVNEYDVIVLDRGLPLLSGDQVCAELSTTGRLARILMLTAASAVADRVNGLQLGADDYLSKPFAFAELVARVQALGRRSQAAVPPILERSGVRLDPHMLTASRDGTPLSLSRKEFGVLTELLRAGGAVVSAEHLLEKVWDEHADPFTGTVRYTIMMLRRKLGPPPIVETETGAGYRLR